MTLDAARLEETRSLLGDVTFTKFLLRLEDEMNAFVGWIDSGAALTSEDTGLRCHTLASSAGLYGAKELRTALLAAEKAAKSDNPFELSVAIQDVATIWSDTLNDIRELI